MDLPARRLGCRRDLPPRSRRPRHHRADARRAGRLDRGPAGDLFELETWELETWLVRSRQGQYCLGHVGILLQPTFEIAEDVRDLGLRSFPGQVHAGHQEHLSWPDELESQIG